MKYKMNFVNRVDVKETGITFVSAELATAIRGKDLFSGDYLLENFFFSVLYTWFRSKYPYVDDASAAYYLRTVLQSVGSQAIADVATRLVMAESGKPKAKEIIVEGLVKYIAVMVGDSLAHSMLETSHMIA